MRLFGREKTTSGHYQIQSMWQCECHSNHYVALEYDEEPDGQVKEGHFSVIDESRANVWLTRLTAALKVLRGRSHVWSEVILDAEAARQMAIDLELLADKIGSLRATADSPARETA